MMIEKQFANRRRFLAATSTAFAGLALYGCASGKGIAGRPSAGQFSSSQRNSTRPFGELVKDPEGLLDLPQGFEYRILSTLGDAMDDGFLVPDHADGMGCFDLGNNEIALIRNHELEPSHDGGGVSGRAYDTQADTSLPLPGGTTTLVLDAQTLNVKHQFRSLAGTIRNCAGGTTPWGSWLSCEETVTKAGGTIKKDHGYVFEVPARSERLIEPVPLRAMGRFNHEAACVDPANGIVYMTEDRDDSLLYRFLPRDPGNLISGGELQALAIEGVADTRNWSGVRHVEVGQLLSAEWVPLENPDSPDDDLRHRGAAAGATMFARGEGMFMGAGEFYFTATSGGLAGHGQIFRLQIDPTSRKSDILELFFESSEAAEYSYGDNLCIAPFGHLVVCEDQYTDEVSNHLRGITPDGDSYPLAFLRKQTELAGACFSPDGKTLFVNAYSPSMTIAINGPWPVNV